MDITTLIAHTNIQPRPYQERIVGRAVDLCCVKGLRSILIDSPTGSGKTIMGLLIARALQESLGLRVGWVAMRRYLLAQHRAAQSMTLLHQVVRPRFILGLSATPFRADRVKLCFDAVLKDAGIASLIRDGYLSPFHHYTIPHHSPARVVECYLREPERWGKSILYFH